MRDAAFPPRTDRDDSFQFCRGTLTLTLTNNPNPNPNLNPYPYQARDWTHAMLNPAVSNATRKELFLKAANMHVSLAKAAQAGEGVDRHLTALLNLCHREGWPVPDFMNDPLYKQSKSWKLSTSNVTTPMLKLFNFGAVCHDGYGIGYMTHPDHIPINITWFKDNGTTDGEQFAHNVQKSLEEIAGILSSK